MAPRAPAVNVSFTVDSASEDESRDELNVFPTPDSNSENKPARKARGKSAQMAKTAAATKTAAKGKAPARRASGNGVLGVKKQGVGVAKKPVAKNSRKVLAELQNANGSDTEEVDEFEADVETAAPIEAKTTRRGRPPKGKMVDDAPEAPAAPVRKTRKAADKDLELKKDSKTKPPPKARNSRRVPVQQHEPETITIPETQPEPEPDEMDIEQSIEAEEIPESIPPPQRPSGSRVKQRGAARQTLGTHRAGSASDTERDPTLRRRVGDLTQKLDAMTLKYDALKEVASSGKDSNFDSLKKRTEQTAKDQDAVIKALKQQITEMQSRASEISTLRKEMIKLEKENTRLSTDIKKLGDSLASAQSENKTLSNKLTAARSSAPPESKNVPGSAVKPRVPGVVLPGTAEATKEAQFQKQKTELYSDLTNLIVLGVKKTDDDEEVYDCLQAGRNGTLHFHLTVTAGGESYEETEFVYNPLLDEQRDRELIELLPDYLTEEICFPRAQAPKFYTKVVDSMSKKIVIEDD